MNTVFVLLFLVGLIGFVSMVALGVAHSGGGHHHHGGDSGAIGHHTSSLHVHHNGHLAHAHAPAHAGGHAHGHAQGDGEAQGHSLLSFRTKGFRPWYAISPLDIFSYCLGAGATGILLRGVVPPEWLTATAVCGALFFNFGLIKPLIGVLLRFATRESQGLEGSVAKPAEALSNFDRQGRGLVQVTMDGQYVQLLAMLDSLEIERGTQVKKGERLLVVEVDPHRNSCRVIRELDQ